MIFTMDMPGDAEGIGQILLLLRGSIVNYYAQIEYNFTDFCARCSFLPEYKNLVRKIPYKTKGRLALSKSLFAVPGPLARYAELIDPLIDKLSTYEETRHIMAHGIMFFDQLAEDPKMTFVTFQTFDVSRAPRIDRLECTVRALEEKVLELGRYAADVLFCIAQIIDDLQMPHPPFLFV